MIKEIHKGNGSGYVVLYVFDYHAEYVLPPLENEGEGFTRQLCVFDEFELSEAGVTEDTIQRVWEELPEGIREWGGDRAGGHVYLLQGTQEQLRGLWKRFWDTIKGGPNGGDCDHFDYWPNAFDLAWQLAEDLDMLEKGTRHRGRMARDMKGRGQDDDEDGDIMEWGLPKEWKEKGFIDLAPLTRGG